MKKLAFLLIFLATFALSCKKDTLVVKTFDVGVYKVHLLMDTAFTGSKDLLVGASEDMLKKYVPNGIYPMIASCFAVQTADKTILIDSGTGANLLNNLAKIKIDPKQIDLVLITHMHYDHIGGLLKDGKAVFPNADIYISQPEHQYWMDEKEMEKAGEAGRGNFQLAADVVKAYGPKIKLFTPNELETWGAGFYTHIGSGVEYGALKPDGDKEHVIIPIAAYGHTPGHTMYEIISGAGKLLIWGDLVHAMNIQMPHPDVAMKFDIDNKQAIDTREKILKYVSDNKIPVAGMHIVPPTAGTIEASGEGYSFKSLK